MKGFRVSSSDLVIAWLVLFRSGDFGLRNFFSAGLFLSLFRIFLVFIFFSWAFSSRFRFPFFVPFGFKFLFSSHLIGLFVNCVELA